MPSELTAGFEYQYDDINDKMPGYNRYLQQTTQTTGLFLQNEWKNDRFNILLGGRFDTHNLLNNMVLSPRVNLKYNFTHNLNWRGSYAAGFRAPQAFDEDLHIDAVGGTVKLIEIADALRPEYSHTFSTSLDYYFKIGRVETNLLVEGFSTRINDIFILVDQGENAAGQIIMERQNGSGARVNGVNLEGKIAPSTRYQLQFGYTLQKSLYDQAERWSDDVNVPAERKLLRTPDQYGYFNMSYNATKKLLLNFTGTYTGSMLAPHFAGYITSDRLEKTPAFADINLKATYDVRLNGIAMQLSAGAKNIFNSYQTDLDKGALRDAGYVYGPSLPRSFFVGLKFSN
jgi:outer membrane receptor for ferrienterochelin and colicins